MLKFLVKTLRPPTAEEWRKSWKGILIGGAFALVFVIGSLGDDHSFVWYTLEAFSLYIITFLSVIGDRIAESEREK